MSERRHWWHVSEKYHGPVWEPKRITPPLLAGSGDWLDEPKTPRLCVCPRLVLCFVARLCFYDVHVYRTEKERRGIFAAAVHDAPITREHWLIPPVKMIHMGVIQQTTTVRISGRTWGILQEIMKGGGDPFLTHLQKARALADAHRALRSCPVFGPSKADRKYAAGVLKWFYRHDRRVERRLALLNRPSS